LALTLIDLTAGYAGSVDSYQRGSRDDLAEAYAHALEIPPTPVDPPRHRPRPRAAASEEYGHALQSVTATVHEPDPIARERYPPATPMYTNDGYSTDHSPVTREPIRREDPPSTEHYQPTRNTPRDYSYNQPEESHYVNTSNLFIKPRDEPVDLAQQKRKEMYNRSRPSRPPPEVQPPPTARTREQPTRHYEPPARSHEPSAHSYDPPQRAPVPIQPPSYETSERQARSRPGYATGYSADYKADSIDRKSVGSLDSDFSSVGKQPLTYDCYPDEEYSRKPFETDVDSEGSQTPLNHRSPRVGRSIPPVAYARPSPLARGEYRSEAPSDYAPSQSRHLTDSQRELAQFGYPVPRDLPPAETDIDAMSDMTDDWTMRGPPRETDF